MGAPNGASGAAEGPFPPASRRLRLGIVGGGRGSFVEPVHLDGALQREPDLVFGVTCPFPGHAMVPPARQMVAEEALGALRRVHVAFCQEWAVRTGTESGLVP